jgi:hypothetical protein
MRAVASRALSYNGARLRHEHMADGCIRRSYNGREAAGGDDGSRQTQSWALVRRWRMYAVPTGGAADSLCIVMTDVQWRRRTIGGRQ